MFHCLTDVWCLKSCKCDLDLYSSELVECWKMFAERTSSSWFWVKFYLLSHILTWHVYFLLPVFVLFSGSFSSRPVCDWLINPVYWSLCFSLTPRQFCMCLLICYPLLYGFFSGFRFSVLPFVASFAVACLFVTWILNSGGLSLFLKIAFFCSTRLPLCVCVCDREEPMRRQGKVATVIKVRTDGDTGRQPGQRK